MSDAQTGTLSVQAPEELLPRCHHCGSDLQTIDASRLHATGTFGFGKRYVYSCPQCRAVLGISHRKGFWMG